MTQFLICYVVVAADIVAVAVAVLDDAVADSGGVAVAGYNLI